ncbi:unnamed protein product [Boreogadus saida]
MPPKKHKSGHQKRQEKEARSSGRGGRAGAQQDIKHFFSKNESAVAASSEFDPTADTHPQQSNDAFDGE